MLGQRDRYSGNILLYDYLSRKRAPIFLDRNLTRALRVHQYILTHGDTEAYPGPDHDLRSEWRPPSWDVLNEMVEEERSKGCFVLEIHGIKSLNSAQPAQPSSAGVHAKKSRVLLRVTSTIRVSIFPSSSDFPCTSVPPQGAVLRAIDRDSDGGVSVETETITIAPERISSDPGKLGFGEDYKMVLSVNFADRMEAEDLYACMGVGNTADVSTRLSTTYGNILECLEGRTTLPLTDLKKQLDFGLEVSMYWNATSNSPLTRYNRQLSSAAERPTSYPTPPLDADSQSRYKVTFLWGNGRFPQKSGLACPLQCPRKFSDIYDLQMHVRCRHNETDCKFVDKRIDEQGVEHWKFRIETAPRQATDSDQRASDLNISVVAPEQPFDRRKYLEGNDEYHLRARLRMPARDTSSRAAVAKPMATPIPLRRKPPDEVEARPNREKKIYIVPKAPPGVTFFRSISKRPLEEGEEISESDDEVDSEWFALRKAAEIDKLEMFEPAKRFLKGFDSFMEDEHIQSDFHAADALVRFVRDKGAWLWQAELIDPFKGKLDELLEDELLTKETHAACLELVQAQKPNAQEGIELSQRLAELDMQTAEASGSLAGHRADKGPKPKKARKGKGKGKAKITDTGHLTPITADSDGDVQMRDASLSTLANAQAVQQNPDADTDPPYDQCYCGEDALSSLGAAIIACNAIDCIRRHFHLDCAQKHSRIPIRTLNLKKRDWTCDGCKQASDTAS